MLILFWLKGERFGWIGACWIVELSGTWQNHLHELKIVYFSYISVEHALFAIGGSFKYCLFSPIPGEMIQF